MVEADTLFKSARNYIDVDVVCGGSEKPLLFMNPSAPWAATQTYEIDLNEVPYFYYSEYTDSMGCGVSYAASTVNTPANFYLNTPIFQETDPAIQWESNSPIFHYKLLPSYLDVEG